MRRRFGPGAAAAVLAVALVAGSGCSILTSRGSSPVKMPGTSGNATGLVPAKLQTTATLGTLIAWKDLKTLNPRMASYKKLGRDAATGTDIYGPAPSTGGSPDDMRGSDTQPGTGGNGSAGTGPASATGTSATAGATPLLPGMYVLVDSSGAVVGVRAQLPPGVADKPWYDRRNMSNTNGTNGTAATGAKGTGTGGTTTTGAGAGGTGPGAAGNGPATRTGMTTGATTAGPTVTALFTSRGSGANGNAAGTNGNGAGTNGNGSNAGTNTASKAGTSNLTSWSSFKKDNPLWSDATRLTDFVQGMGYHYGHRGPGMAAMVDRASNVTAFEASIPAQKDGSDWHPWYDQLPGMPMYDPATGSYMWSQHVYFVLSEAIR